jgi:hypothetical protein
VIVSHGDIPATDAENASGVLVVPKEIETGNGGELLAPDENTTLPGLAVKDGALEIVTVTGIMSGRPGVPGEVTTIDDWYTPGVKAFGESAIVKVAGAVFEFAVTVRKLPPTDTTALIGIGDPSLLVIVICWFGGVEPPD